MDTDAKTLDSGYKGAGTDVTLNNGNIKIDKQGIVTYTPNKYMSSVDKANYAVNYKVDNGKTDRYAYATVNVLPATSVYYEDDFGRINGSGNTVIKWSGHWDTATSEKTADNEYQGSDNKQYGWDKSYENDSKFSNGSAHVTTINDANPTATAEFTFTGTGVDIYTKTDNKTGTVVATVYKVENGQETVVDDLIMDNKAISNGENGYYQIPTLFFHTSTYGTYKVKIRVTNAAKTRTTYYLDGIRVYNPLGLAPSDPIAQEAYKDAGEYNAKVKTVRDILLDAKTFNAGSVNNGAVFIDETNDKDGNATGSSGTADYSTIGTYEDLGPKNEVYLSPGKAIAFEINSGYENLFIGAKAPNGVTKMLTTDEENAKGIDITSASDMYYPITAKDAGNGKKYVVIKNTGNNILSITKIRATGEGYSALNIECSDKVVAYASTFSSLSVSDTDSSGMVIPKDDGNVDIDNSGNKDNNQQEDNNNTNKPSSFWDKIMNSFKHWFR